MGVSVAPGSSADVTIDFTDGWGYGSTSDRWPFAAEDNLTWAVNAIDSAVSGVTADGTSLVAGASDTLHGGVKSLGVTVVADDATSGGKISMWVTTASSSVTVRYEVEVIVEVEVEPCPAGSYGSGGAACYTW